MWWDHDLVWVGWLVMMIGMAGFWILVALLVVALMHGDLRGGPRGPDPREILERRLALGEIDADEYQQRLDALTQAHR